MVALEHYQALFSRTAAGTIGLQLPAKIAKVYALRVYAFDNSVRLAPLPSLKADLDKLLFHADGSADAQIFRKPTNRAYFRHNFVQLLLLVRADIDSDSI
jgi:hypothetical protein